MTASEVVTGGEIPLVLVHLMIFLAGALTTLVFVFLGRAAFGLMRPVMRLFRGGARRAGLKSMTHTRPARAAAPGARHRKGREHLTAVEWALEQPSDIETPGQASGENYNFGAERRILKKDGQVFKWLRIPGEYIPKSLSEPFSDEVADFYLANARALFSRPVSLHADENNFYEDEEGATLVGLFRNTDRRCFYALDQLRRVINANARRFIVWLASLLTAVTVCAWGTPYFLAKLGLPGSAPFIGGAASIVILFVLYFFATFFLQAFYANSQRQNMREFSDFLTRYLGHIANQFRESSAKTSRVIQGDERNSKVLAANAQKWHKIMIWLGLRPFFIEAFVRNVHFQVRRNLNYYVFGSILWFTVIAPLALYYIFETVRAATSYSPPTLAAAAIGVGYFAFAALSIWQILRKVVFEELNQMNWLGFDNLEVGAQMDEVIGKYAEDIGLWKGRFDR